ncbi:uncharacterized protein swt1 isoform X2 [Brachyhypopomus gauderio]|uniref:uncharacterized protein swt1 isoform X2 n=1 Tax=Brachyhypopomus gauderio TaxID=698409 RepID=UPI0040433731
MGRRKSKKHRRERSRGSTPPREDQRKNDIETPGRSRGKTKHERIPSQGGNNPKWVKGTNSLRSAREGSPTKHTCKKPEGENRQAEPTRNKASLGCDRKGLRLPAKHLPLAHGVLTMAKSRDPEVSSKELEQRRRCLVKRRAPEEPRRKPAEAAVLPAGETRKEGVKRRSSTPEDHPAAKLRATGAQAAVTCRAKTGAAHSKESLSQVMCLTPKLPQHVCPQTRSGERERRRAGPSSGEQPASSSPPITFKIPKKPQSAAKVRRDADVFGVDGDDVSGSDGKRAPRGRVTAASPSASPSASVSGRSVPRLPEVPSTPSISSSPRQPSYVLQAQLGRPGASRERSFPSTSSASPRTERAVYRRASTETKDALDNDQEMLLVEELHLARFDRRLTVSVAESYGELTCMDVDPPEEGANTSLSEEHQDLLIVLDTNVLLSHLDFVKKMRSHGLGVLGRPTLLVPWVVLQELDALKSGKLSPEVERKARPAVRYVYGCLKNQEPRLWGQSLQQASQAACGLVAENNDDRVLHCCLQYQALYPEGSLILCTNDQNLCSKALLSGVRALCKADLEEHAQGNTALVQSSCRLHTPAPPAGPTLPEQTRRPREEEEEAGRMKASGVKCELSVCVSALERSLQGALSAVLEEEMKAAYEDLWTEIVYLKPPWTLQAVLQCIRKHWIAVFGGIIKRNLLSCVEMLITCFCSGGWRRLALLFRWVEASGSVVQLDGGAWLSCSGGWRAGCTGMCPISAEQLIMRPEVILISL